jgi:hypothetical protein
MSVVQPVLTRFAHGEVVPVVDPISGISVDPHPHHSPEACLCIAVIERAIKDLSERPIDHLEYLTARSFFTSTRSNWNWMSEALQEVKPTFVVRHAFSIIERRESHLDGGVGEVLTTNSTLS